MSLYCNIITIPLHCIITLSWWHQDTLFHWLCAQCYTWLYLYCTINTLCIPLHSTLKSFELVNWSAFIKVTVLCTAFALPFRVQVCTYSIQSCAELLFWTAQMHFSILEIIPLYCPTTQTLQCTAVELWISSPIVALRGPSLHLFNSIQCNEQLKFTLDQLNLVLPFGAQVCHGVVPSNTLPHHTLYINITLSTSLSYSWQFWQ